MFGCDHDYLYFEHITAILKTKSYSLFNYNNHFLAQLYGIKYSYLIQLIYTQLYMLNIKN